MRNLFFTLVLFIFCIPFSVSAEMMVIQVNPYSLSYELSPTNYNNSPSNYENSLGRNRLYSQERVIVS